MKENQVLLFRQLSRAVWGEVQAETEDGFECLTHRLHLHELELLAGEVSYIQIETSSLLVQNLPSEYLPDLPKRISAHLSGDKLFGRYGTVRSIDSGSPGDHAKTPSNVKVNYSSPVESSLALLVISS